MRSEAKKLVRPHLVLVSSNDEHDPVFRGPLSHYPEPIVHARPTAYDAEGLGIVDEKSGLRRKSIPPQAIEMVVGDDELVVLEDRNPIDFDQVAHWYPAHAKGGDDEVPAAPGIPQFRVSRITLVPN
jgi:hypothetical protein